MGHKTCAVSCAQRVIDAALRFQPDVSLLDWAIRPDDQLCLKLALSGTPIVAVAGSADARRLRQAGDARFAAVLSLPCPRAELSKLLADLEDEVVRQQRALDDAVAAEAYKSQIAKWQWLMQTLVIRFYGGMRDGQELMGQRAVDLYRLLNEAPLGRSFLACRFRCVTDRCDYEEAFKIIERQRYFVEDVVKSPSGISVVARYHGPKKQSR